MIFDADYFDKIRQSRGYVDRWLKRAGLSASATGEVVDLPPGFSRETLHELDAVQLALFCEVMSEAAA